MGKMLLAWMLVMTSWLCSAQSSDMKTPKYVYSDLNFSFVFHSPYTADGAKSDIQEKKMKIFVPGGFSSMPDFFNKRDWRFENTYHIEFVTTGCLRFGPDEDQEGYNQQIFKYLDFKYGKDWRNEIRRDASGLEMR